MFSLNDEAQLQIFWAGFLILFFSAGYGLRLWEGTAKPPPLPRILFTLLVGNLAILVIFGSVLSGQAFEVKDCSVLLAVVVQGWMADSFVGEIVARTGARGSHGLG